MIKKQLDCVGNNFMGGEEVYNSSALFEFGRFVVVVVYKRTFEIYVLDIQTRRGERSRVVVL